MSFDFEPEALHNMSSLLSNLAQTGVHDFETLLAETLERFRH
jgi:hypothetical protein